MSIPAVPFAWARLQKAVIADNDGLTLFCQQNTPLRSLAELARVSPGSVKLVKLDEKEFEERLLNQYQQNSGNAQQAMENLGSELDFYTLAEELPEQQDLLDEQDDAPIIRLINAMLSEAIKERASDIHIETYENELVIRFRVDGVLKKILTPQRQLAALLVSRIKVMSKLDIAEKRIPQDGRIALRIAGRSIDVRVSVIPVNHGERVVMRLLDKSNVSLELSSLGMKEENLNAIIRIINQSHGIILVTGPTGSGKSTTLYALLNQINDENRNIMTIEDPVEFELPGVSQTQVNTKVDMTFARGLRALLRQDPDVILIGEIRDAETAQIAVQASLTGHLVLSTLHTNTAIGAITRLRDMGVEPFLLASSLSGVLAQRLVRRLCNACRQPYVLAEDEIKLLQLPEGNSYSVWQPVGCEQCNGQGYRGRLAVHELLVIDEKIRHAIHQQASETDILQLTDGLYQSLRQDAIRKMFLGQTSLEEVLRVTIEDDNGEV